MGELQFRTNVNVNDLKLDANKPTVLIVTDSATLHSGFGQVVRNIFKRLWADREWNILQVGWWHQYPMEQVPWQIITTNRDPNDPRNVTRDDAYGQISFESTVGAIKPDLVWVMGDPWMIGPVMHNKHSDSYIKMLYIPVDGAPLLDPTWQSVERADIVVPYLPWGADMIKTWFPKANVVDPIPHGVDTSVYSPANPGMRSTMRAARIGVTNDDVVMLSVSRNQGRKNLPALVELTYYIRSGDYMVCSECGRAYRNPYDYHRAQPSGERAVCTDPTCWSEYPEGGHREPKMTPGTPHPNFVYYIHTPIKDLEEHSWNLLTLLDVFKMGKTESDGNVVYPGLRWNESVKIVHGIPERHLAQMYSGADIFALPTLGEGFGLPILEAMSCGVPVVVPDTSSHPDFVREGGGLLVDINQHNCEVVSSYYRGWPDMDDYLTKLLMLVDNTPLRHRMGEAGRQVALRYDWDSVALKWKEIINTALKESKPTKRWYKLTTI